MTNTAKLKTPVSAVKIRVLFLPSIDNDETNAQSLNTREIALRLSSDRFESTVFYEREPDPRLRQHPGVRLKRLPRRGKTLQVLKEQLSGYDLIAYIDCSPASCILLRLPRRLRPKTKVVLHEEAPQAQSADAPPSLKSKFQLLASRSDICTGVTEFVARDFYQAYARHVQFVLPVGVECALFVPPASRNNSIPTVLFVGTVIARKGPQIVLDAAAQFRAAHFRVVGAIRANYDSVLKQRIKDFNLTNVTLEGPRSQVDVLRIMRESDIFLLPSRLEGLPKVTLEAAATGLPCIVFHDYQTPSVVDGVTGFQVSTIEEMMERLGQLIQNQELRRAMGVSARKHAQTFDWDLVGKRWEEAYFKIALQS